MSALTFMKAAYRRWPDAIPANNSNMGGIALASQHALRHQRQNWESIMIRKLAMAVVLAGSPCVSQAEPRYLHVEGTLTSESFYCYACGSTITTINDPFSFTVIYNPDTSLPLLPPVPGNGSYDLEAKSPFDVFNYNASTLSGNGAVSANINSTSYSLFVLPITSPVPLSISLNLALANPLSPAGLVNLAAGSSLVITTSRYSSVSGVVTYATTLASAAPEPDTWAMMIAGFVVVGFGMRRRGPRLKKMITTNAP